MTPLPGWKVVPAKFSQHHRPTAVATMPGKCEVLSSAGTPPFPLPVGWVGFTTVVPEKACRVEPLNREGGGTPTEQPTRVREVRVVVPVDATTYRAGEGGHFIRLTACDDPQLIGRILRVMNVEYGTLVFERTLVCLDNLTQNP